MTLIQFRQKLTNLLRSKKELFPSAKMTLEITVSEMELIKELHKGIFEFDESKEFILYGVDFKNL